MNHDIDQQTDISLKRFYNICHSVDLPTFVKEAELTDAGVGAVLDLDPAGYAHPMARKYPCHNKEAIFVSNAYFKHAQQDLTKKYGKQYVDTIDQNIKQAAEYAGITDDLEKFDATFFEKQAHVDEDVFVSSFDDVDGGHFEFYPVKTASEFRGALGSFTKDIKKYPFDWRRKIASDFVEKATQFEVDEIPDIVAKYAGLFFPDLEKVPKELARRKTKVAASDQPIYDQLIENLVATEETEDFFKAAEVCHQLEKLAGCYNHKETRLALGDPVDMLFTVSLSKVADQLDVIEMGGHIYHMRDLKKIGSTIYKAATGIDIDPKNDAELRDVLPTLPRTDVALLEEMGNLQPIG